MANTKMTKKDYFALLSALVANASDIEDNTKSALNDFINHEVEQLSKKYTANKSSKKHEENKDIKAVILAELAEIGKPVTITEMQNSSAPLANYTCQKLSALVKQLVTDEKVKREVIKKKSYFSVSLD